MTSSPLWTSADAVEATGGQANGNWTATGVSIDTRTLKLGDLFVAITGPNFNGHTFVHAAFEAGARGAIVADRESNILNGKPGLIVADPLEALKDLAAAARQRTAAKVVAITGSVGKTSTKAALAHVLSRQGKVCSSQNSLNNHWGLPLSVARLPEKAGFGVFEIGMSQPGEITPLTELAQPDVAIITAIAPAHMKFFKSMEDIARAKAEIFLGLSNGIAIINRDTEHFDLLRSRALGTGAAEIYSYGRSTKADMQLIECTSAAEGNLIEARWKGRTIRYFVRQPGVQWGSNSLAVLAATNALEGDLDAAANDLSTLPSIPGRGSIHVIPWGLGTIHLIDDSYNANPDSVCAALETLGKIHPKNGRRVAILGDMLELGDMSKFAHVKLKEQIETNAIDVVFLAGREITALADVLDPSCLAALAETAEGIMPEILGGLRPGDVVTVKASNQMGMGRVVETLINPDVHPHATNVH